MALVRWSFGDEEEREKEQQQLSAPRVIQSVQQGAWQPTQVSSDGTQVAQAQKPENYLMSEQKAQVDEGIRQRRAAEEAARAQAAAEAQARAQAAAQMQAQAQAQPQQVQKRMAHPGKDHNGWKKYYGEEFNKAQKGLGTGFQGFINRMIDGGQASKQAEIHARNRYNNELLAKAYDNSGNTLNQAAANKSREVADYNMQRAMQSAQEVRARINAMGANSKRFDQGFWNQMGRQVNAIKGMSLYDGAFGVNDTHRAGFDDAGRFVGNLAQGIVTMPLVGAKEVAEAARGRGTDAQTGLERELNGVERLGRGVSGALNITLPFMTGGGVKFMDDLFGVVAKGTATQAQKATLAQILRMSASGALTQGGLGAAQATGEWAGNGGSLLDEKGNLNEDKVKEFVEQVGTATAMSAAGGAVFAGGGGALRNIRRGREPVPVPRESVPQPEATPVRPDPVPVTTPVADGNVNFTPVRPNTPETPNLLARPDEPVAGNTPAADGVVQPVNDVTPATDGTVAPREAELPEMRPVTPEQVAPEPETPQAADGAIAPRPLPEGEANMPVIRSEEVRQLQEARAGTTQAEEAVINQRLQQIEAETPRIDAEADADVPVRLDDTETAADSATRMKAIRDGDERYFDSGTEKVARERFDIPNLKKISSGGSDRDVYDLGDGNVLKVAKTKRGLIQNQAEIDGYAQQVGLIPETRESGLNYVVAEKVDPPDANTRAMVRQMKKIDSEKGRESAEMWEFLQENGLDDIMNYENLWNDFTSIRNWGTRNGEPIHVDGGTLAGRDMNDAITKQFDNRRRGIKNNNLDDPEFRKIYDRSRTAKKKFGDGDNATMYDKSPDLNSVKPYSGGLDDIHQERIDSLKHNANAMFNNAQITQRDIDSAQKSIDMWNEGGRVSPGLKATLTKEKSQAESFRKAQQILETSAPNRIYTTDAKGNVVEHPASHILEAFSKSVGEDMPPIVISGRPHDGKGMNFGSIAKRANGTYAHTLGVIKYKSKNSVYHETVHNIDMSIRDYKGDNPKMLKLQQLRKEITPAEIAKFRKLEDRVKNDREYVAYAMEQLYDGRINAGTLGEGVLRYVKEFFTTIKDAFSSSTRYNRPKFNDAVEYIKELDRAIHQVDKELAKRGTKPTPKSVTPIKSKSTIKPTPKPEPEPVKPVATKPKSNLPEGMTPVKPSKPSDTPKPVDPDKQARKDFANVFTRSTDSNSEMGTRLRNATGMTQEDGSEVAQILADAGITGKQAERITKLFDRAAEIAESNKATQKQYRKDFIKGGKEAIDDAPARQRNRETEEAAYVRNQLNSELKKLERKGDWGEKLTQGFENIISGKNANQLIGAPIERGLTAEVIGNAMNTIKAPIRQIRGATMHGMPGKSAVKRLIRDVKTPPKTVTEGYKYLIGNTYRAAMTPAQALADSRKGALRTELTKYAYKNKIGKELSNKDAERVSRMAGNDMEALVNMGAGVDNGIISIFAYRKALKQWKQFIESGSEADYGKFMDTIDRQTSIVDKLAQGFSTQGKNRAQRAGLTLVNALLPYMRNAVNMSTRGVVLDLNPFTLSLLDGIRTDQRGFMSNLALGIKNKTVDYAVLAALGSVLTYNDGTDPDTVDQPRGVSIHLGGDEYFAIRGTPLELPLGALMVAKQLAQDGVEGKFKDVGYYGGMITPSIPYADYMTSHGNVIDSIEKWGTEEGDGGYAAKNFLVGNAKSLTPFSNNNIEASLSRFGEGESLTAKTVYASKEVPDGEGGTKKVADMPQWYLNSLANNNLGEVLPFVPKRSELKDSRDAAGRVRTVDNQGSWMRKKINDADTKKFNPTITDLVQFGRDEGLGKGTQDMFSTYAGDKNHRFKGILNKVTFLDAPEVDGKSKPDNATKLQKNEKLAEFNQQIYNGFFGDGAEELLKLNGEELRSEVTMPNKNNPDKNSGKPISIGSIRNAIAQTDLPGDQWEKLNAISEDKSALAARAKAGEIAWSDYYAALPSYAEQENAILSNSKGAQKLGTLMNKLKDSGFFEPEGLGSTRAGQAYLWNSLNALLGQKGKTPAAEWKKDESGKGFTPWGRRGGRGGSGGSGFNAIYKPGEYGAEGIKWTPVKARQMANVARAKYTPVNIRVKLGNEVKRNRTQNYADRSF